MAINTNLLNALNQIVSDHGGVETLSNSKRVKALLSDLAAGEPKPQKNALIACIEQGFPAMLQNVRESERGQAKAKLAERLNHEEGLDAALCADMLDMLEAALFKAEKNGTETETGTETPGKKFCTACGAALPIEARFCYACGGAVASGAVSEVTPEVPALVVEVTPEVPVPVYPVPQVGEVWRELGTLAMHTGGVLPIGVQSLAYSPDGCRIASAGNDIRIWDAVNGGKLQTFKGHKGFGVGIVTSVAYSPDGRRIASGAEGRIIRIWDAESGRELRTLKGHANSVLSAVQSHDGRRIVSEALDYTVKAWEAESEWKLQNLGRFTRLLSSVPKLLYVLSVVYSPDGRRIASGAADKTVRIWDAENGRELRILKGHTDPVIYVTYSLDGRRIASGSADNTVKIWDAESGGELRTLAGHTGWVWSVAYSPDGRRIASGSRDKTVRIWDAESGQEMLTLAGHTSEVHSVAYSPDGRRIASGSEDKTIRIWDAESGRELGTLYGHIDQVDSVVYSPDGRRIASGSHDNTIRIWGRE